MKRAVSLIVVLLMFLSSCNAIQWGSPGAGTEPEIPGGSGHSVPGGGESSAEPPAVSETTPPDGASGGDKPGDENGEQTEENSGNTFPFPFGFTAQDLYDNTVTEADLGKKELFFVHYWATWCGPCVNEMPDLSRVVMKYADRVGFIALLDDYSTSRASAILITESSGVDFIMVDARSKAFRDLLQLVQSGYIPTTVLIDREGNVVGGQIIGAFGSEYGRLIEEALEAVVAG